MNNILKEIKLEVQRKINIQKNKEVSTDQEVLKIINNLKPIFFFAIFLIAVYKILFLKYYSFLL